MKSLEDAVKFSKQNSQGKYIFQQLNTRLRFVSMCLATETLEELNAFLFDVSLLLISSFSGNSVTIMTFMTDNFQHTLLCTL